MEQRIIYVGLDVHKDTIAVALAEAGKGAINRYFDERNRHFREHPRRAGKRIWGKERVPPEFADGNCCKDPRFR